MIRVYPSTLNGSIKAPASKSHAQRLLFMSSMPAYPTWVKNIPQADDIDTTIACLKELGCQFAVSKDGKDVKVAPFIKTSPLPEAEFNFKESATTARLAIALCAALGIKANCKASGTLPRRKMVDMTGRLAIRGVTFSSFSLPFNQSGRMEGGEYSFRGDEGEEAISAMMMFLPCLLHDSELKIETPLIDRTYVDLTKAALGKFKIKIEETENGFKIPGKQFYQTPKEITVENDWALGAMWATAGAACYHKGGEVAVTGLPKNSPQQYRDLGNMLALVSQDFKECSFDMSKMPNLATVLAAMAIVKGASITLTGVPQLKARECNRLQAMAAIGRNLGQMAIATDSEIIIHGMGEQVEKDDIEIDCQGDPWIFMSMVLASTVNDHSIILTDEHCADKVYKNFLADFKSLGGKFDII